MRKGFTLVEILIVVAIVALLATLLLPGLLRSRMSANEAYAQSALKSVASAAEMYANDNDGNYPTAISQLTGANPPYLTEDVTNGTKKGYSFSCNLTSTGYSCTATPANCGKTGSKTYTITTGGVLTSAACQ